MRSPVAFVRREFGFFPEEKNWLDSSADQKGRIKQHRREPEVKRNTNLFIFSSGRRSRNKHRRCYELSISQVLIKPEQIQSKQWCEAAPQLFRSVSAPCEVAQFSGLGGGLCGSCQQFEHGQLLSPLCWTFSSGGKAAWVRPCALGESIIRWLFLPWLGGLGGEQSYYAWCDANKAVALAPENLHSWQNNNLDV